MRVLIVEDHAKLATTMAIGLRQAGMAVDVVFDGQDALDHLALTAYDVVVLDRDIPGVHGDDICKALVAEGSPSRVLMLTAAGAVQDRVEGLGIGADDYLPKPCDFTERGEFSFIRRESNPGRPGVAAKLNAVTIPTSSAPTKSGLRCESISNGDWLGERAVASNASGSRTCCGSGKISLANQEENGCPVASETSAALPSSVSIAISWAR